MTAGAQGGKFVTFKNVFGTLPNSNHFPLESIIKMLHILPLSYLSQIYDKQEVIGRGSYGTVHILLQSGKTFAGKFIPCEKASQKLKIYNEISILKSLAHEHIVQLIDAFEDPDTFVQGIAINFDYLT